MIPREAKVAQATPKAAPAPAAAPQAPAGSLVLTAPTTKEQIIVLRATRDEISSQLSNVKSRRDDLARQLRNALPGADRAGLEARISQLDGRLLELDKTLQVTGSQLASARGEAAAFAAQQPPTPANFRNGPSGGQIAGIAISFFFAVLMPLTIGMIILKIRRSKFEQSQRVSPQLEARLEQMEQGIDAIAIEVERVSESQRFVTRLLGESNPDVAARLKGAPVAVRRD